MREIEIVGGTTVEEVARRLADEANRTGEAVCALFGNTYLMSNPGVRPEVTLNRYRDDVAEKSEWFRSPNGIAFVESRKKA